MAGYSATPLAKKLGVKASSRLFVTGAPANYKELLAPLPEDVVIKRAISSKTDIIHIFVTAKSDVAEEFDRALKKMRPDAAIWVSWPKKQPKKSEKVPTDLTEDAIRSLALPLGLVDIKVCAVNETWSGLKLVIRKQLRRRTSQNDSIGHRQIVAE